MKNKDMYLIGEASKITGVNTKTLRYYSDLGIIKPDKIDEETGYRYYSKETLLNISVVKYYKQLGYKLSEMKDVIKGDTKSKIREKLADKLNELDRLKREIEDSCRASNDWYNLIKEAQHVIENNVVNVNIKFLEKEEFCYKKQKFNYNYMDAVLSLDWVNYLESVCNEITGPVILGFESYEDKINNKSESVIIMQKALKPHICGTNIKYRSGGTYATIYHIGKLETMHKSYEKLIEWINNKGYETKGNCYERYVVDYWTTRNEDEFVTEILIPIQ